MRLQSDISPTKVTLLRPLQIFIRSCRQIDGIAPTFAKKPAIRQEDDGKRLLFECRITADPTPKVTWFHDGSLVKDSPRHKVSRRLLSYIASFATTSTYEKLLVSLDQRYALTIVNDRLALTMNHYHVFLTASTSIFYQTPSKRFS